MGCLKGVPSLEVVVEIEAAKITGQTLEDKLVFVLENQ